MLPDSSNKSQLNIIRLRLYRNLHMPPVEATRGHHCLQLPHVAILIPKLGLLERK